MRGVGVLPLAAAVAASSLAAPSGARAAEPAALTALAARAPSSACAATPSDQAEPACGWAKKKRTISAAAFGPVASV